MKTSFTVILPILDEKDNIYPLVAAINETFQAKIIIVDDRSTDGTFEKLAEIKKKFRNVKIQINDTRIGLTKSIQKGIDLSDTEYICWMDADFSHPPQILEEMARKIYNYDAIIASWLLEGAKDLRKNKLEIIRSRIINAICRTLFSTSLTSYTSGYIMIRKAVFNNYKLNGDYGEYFIHLVVYLRLNGFRICEVPFDCRSRRKGVSKTNPNLFIFLKRGLCYIKMITSLYIKQYHLLK